MQGLVARFQPTRLPVLVDGLGMGQQRGGGAQLVQERHHQIIRHYGIVDGRIRSLRRSRLLEHVHDPFEVIFGERFRSRPLVVVLFEELIVFGEDIILTRDAFLDRLGETDKGLWPLKG